MIDVGGAVDVIGAALIPLQATLISIERHTSLVFENYIHIF